MKERRKGWDESNDEINYHCEGYGLLRGEGMMPGGVHNWKGQTRSI